MATEEPGTVLLESALAEDGIEPRSYLFRQPERILTTRDPVEVPSLLAEAEEALTQGLYVAGYLAYEAGFAFEPSLTALAEPATEGEPLVWFGVYRHTETWDHTASTLHSEPRAPFPSAIEPILSLTEADYVRQVQAVRSAIATGDTYQANLTIEAHWKSQESVHDLYSRLLQNQPVPYAAVLHLGEQHIVSLSPELFFRSDGETITARPMKGTAARGMDWEQDQQQIAWLAQDEKNRSENVMIVDLLRNDLNRVCQTGSVRATELFAVERYPTVLQMTSTVKGTLRKGIGYAQILRTLFPCGSIVGAPKLHTMRLLHTWEQRRRGVYTGAIGWMAPTGHACFNVAIRTLVIDHQGSVRAGVGSGIVYDSNPHEEYEECRTKLLFASRNIAPFQLIETLLLQDGAYFLLQEHLERLNHSAMYFDIALERDAVQSYLQQAAQGGLSTGSHRVRLLVSQHGGLSLTSTALHPQQAVAGDVLISPHPVQSTDRFLQHKTTHRSLYDKALQQAQRYGCTDALFHNERGEITEGTIHNILVHVDGRWKTPHQRCGLLPGVYRHLLMQKGVVTEAILTQQDLQRATAIYLCNSVRGLRPVARLLQKTEQGLLPQWEAGPGAPQLALTS